MPALPADTDRIVITASRAPELESRTPASVTVIGKQQISRLDVPTLSSLLRLVPSAAVATSGPAGSLTDVRIRGAEANHTLLFVDGININDPASGDVPRFEILNADIASRVEVVRGPQSALWGSEAIGGVIAINGADEMSDTHAELEAGSFGFDRANAAVSVHGARTSLTGAFGVQRATGIDSFGAPGGDLDGYRNVSGRIRGTYQIGSLLKVGLAGIALTSRSEFDGYDPITFEHTDTLDNSRSQLVAGRLWTEFGSETSSWNGRLGASILDSSNRNYLGEAPTNRTGGSRAILDIQLGRAFSTGSVQHRVIVAGSAEREAFRARGLVAGFSTDQDRHRNHQALTAEWRSSASRFTADIAVRRDMFNRFRDATSLRASALVGIGGGFSLAGSYAEGIAQPTFFDLYGAFPNNFIGNPDLKPETSRGFEGSLRFRRSALAASLTAYRQRLHDEIVDVFDPFTFVQTSKNSAGISRRWGLEAEFAWQVSEGLRATANYSFLRATQPNSSGPGQVNELRRPGNSGSLAVDGQVGRWSYGASIAYVGSHLDREEVLPFGIVRVGSYWLANARAAYAISSGVELFVRASNVLNSRYQEVVGYHTEGRGGFLGIRLADRRSSP